MAEKREQPRDITANLKEDEARAREIAARERITAEAFPGATGMTARDKFRRVMLTMADDGTESESRVDDLQEAQIAGITESASEDALYKAMEVQGLTGLKDLENGQVITIHGYTVAKGSGEYKGAGFYAIIEASDADTGEELKLDTGVERVIAFLRMVETGAAGIGFPVTVRIVKKTTANGEMVTLAKARPRTILQ